MMDRRSSTPPPRQRKKTLDGMPRRRTHPSLPSVGGSAPRDQARHLRLSSPPRGVRGIDAGYGGLGPIPPAPRTGARPELEPLDSLLPRPGPQAERSQLERVDPTDSYSAPHRETASPRLELEPLDSLLPPPGPQAERPQLEPVDPYPPYPAPTAHPSVPPIDEAGVPTLLLSPQELQTLDLDHRCGFLLSLIDGMTRVGDLMELSGMPREETEALLIRLVTLGAIELR